jgi:hypothetical protein
MFGDDRGKGLGFDNKYDEPLLLFWPGLCPFALNPWPIDRIDWIDWIDQIALGLEPDACRFAA